MSRETSNSPVLTIKENPAIVVQAPTNSGTGSDDASNLSRVAAMAIGGGDTQQSRPISFPSKIQEQMQMLSMSAPNTSVVVPIEDSRETIHSDDVAIVIEDEKDKSKKNPRKSMDESKKRKDTTVSLSNFFHRLTRGGTSAEDKKEDKNKSPITGEEKEEDKVERPERLPSPDSAEEKWFETNIFLKSIHENSDYRTALDRGHEGNAEIYEWKADSLEERLHTEYPPQLPQNTWTDQENIEQSLDELLEEFRSGHMRALTDNQLEKMRELKREHERVTNMHIATFEMNDPTQKTEMTSEMYSQLAGVFELHKMMDGAFFSNNA